MTMLMPKQRSGVGRIAKAGAVLLLFLAQIASAQSTLDRVTIPFPSELAGPGSERREGVRVVPDSILGHAFSKSTLQRHLPPSRLRAAGSTRLAFAPTILGEVTSTDR